ncbi:MAG: enoyl-CoA hydratase [Alphaproteobacteria bacterium PA3]|nr:MAG: enoyl-CoA hydratase [Alphaproteobacteria bacterium PA3]
MADYNTIKVDISEGILTLTMNRPEKMNAFTSEMMQEMISAFDVADADDSVRAVIVTGSGDRAFCAGADLSAGAKTFDYADRDDRDTNAGAVNADGSIDLSHEDARDGGGRLTLRIFNCKKPVIGAINGAAVCIGVTMQLPMDIRIASTAARFGFVFARRGIVPEACSSWFLPRLVGISQALDWCLSGRVFGAEEALAAGLVKSLHAPEDLLPAAHAIAREIVDNTAPVSVALTRQMMWRMLGADHPMQAHKIDSRGVYSRGQTIDAREGVMSFLEKRPPAYANKVSTDMPDFFPWWDDVPFK